VLSKREKALLAALFWSAAFAACFVTVTLASQRRGALAEQVALARRELSGLEARLGGGAAGAGAGAAALSVAELETRIAGARGRLYGSDEIDPYRFGIVIRDLLRAEGLTISRYQTVEQGSVTLLEFSVDGSARSVARFLQRVSEAPKWWAVSFLSMRASGGDGSLQAVIRIHYEQAGESGG
jgi:hypothetical protein